MAAAAHQACVSLPHEASVQSSLQAELSWPVLQDLLHNEKKEFNHFRGTGGDSSPTGVSSRHVVHQARGRIASCAVMQASVSKQSVVCLPVMIVIYV